jgi:type I restriction enzyme S subunit
MGQQFFAQSQIGGAQKNVNVGTLRKMPVPLPKPSEQRAIATALSDVDGLLSGLDRLIAKKRDLKQAAMQQLLTGQTRLPGFSGVWDVKQLGECAQFCSGAYLAQDDYRDGPFEVQGAGSSMGRHIAANFREPVSVIGRVGTVGRPRFMPNGCWVNNNAGAVVALPGKATPEFIYLLLLTMDWSKSTSVTAQPFLVIESFLRMASKFPSIPEQIAIASVLTAMDAELTGLEERRAKTAAIKQGMMQELLTGRIRLVEAEALHA